MSTFIKSGLWTETRKGYRNWLNLDKLIDNKIAAIPVVAPTGLETVDEGNGTAWKFVGQASGDNINRYKSGTRSLDAMIFDGTSVGDPEMPGLPYGTRSVDGINFGVDNKDNADYNTIVMGAANQTNAYAFATMLGGFHNVGYGYGDTAIGSYNTTIPSNVNSFLTAIGHNVKMTGQQGGVGIGLALVHNSKGAVIVGTSNVPWTGSVEASNRPAFSVGIGTTTVPNGRWEPLVQKDGLNVLFSGEVIADNMTTALIDAEPTGKVLVTREWVNLNKGLFISDTLTAPSSNTDTGAKGEVRVVGTDRYECIATNTWVKSTVVITF